MINFDIQEKKRFSFKVKNNIHYTTLSEINYIEGKSYLTTVYFSKNNEIKHCIYSNNLKNFEKKLVNYGFQRINKNIIVNLSKIKVVCSKNRNIILECGNVFIASVRRFKKFKNLLGNPL